MAISIHEEAIMKQRRPVRIFVVAAIATAALVWTTQSAFAAGVVAPRLAKSYYTWLSSAMEPCDPATLSVVGNLPGGGCPAAKADTVNMRYGTLLVGTRGNVLLVMKGLTLGDTMEVHFMLRATLPSVETCSAGGCKQVVTFKDAEAICPVMTANAKGVIVAKKALTACMPHVCSNGTACTTDSDCTTGTCKAASGLVGSGANVEILSATVVNAATHNAVATSGVRR